MKEVLSDDFFSKLQEAETMPQQFKWTNFYTEFADKLLDYKENRRALIIKLQAVYSQIGMKLPKLDSNGDPKDIDPFTVLGLFNKGISDLNRIRILEGIAMIFGVAAEVPHDFSGVCCIIKVPKGGCKKHSQVICTGQNI